jgi:hypothetical protein
MKSQATHSCHTKFAEQKLGVDRYGDQGAHKFEDHQSTHSISALLDCHMHTANSLPDLAETRSLVHQLPKGK